MKLGLDGKRALVTGGRQGIGAAVVRALAGEGADVAVLDRVGADEALESLRVEVTRLGKRFQSVQADVGSFHEAETAVQRVADAWEGLDILVCSAGITRDRISWKMTAEEWNEVIRVNLTGVFACARAAVPFMRSSGRGGRIVVVSSINGARGKVGQANYAASKAGIHGLVKSLARELGPSSVTVNAVAPGMVDTPMTRSLSHEVTDKAIAETVLGRLATVSEVAAVITFLASTAAGAVTGQVIPVDAGQCL